MTKDEFISLTKRHVANVSRELNFITHELQDRAKSHDHTKFEGSEEYAAFLTDKSSGVKVPYEGSIYQKHAKAERHHFFKEPRDDINLIDLIEALCDGVDAAGRHVGKPTLKDIEIPNLDYQKMVKNTINLLLNFRYK